jgi:ATP-dependent DNA ligase
MTPKFLPMLAAVGEPFDSSEHLFEVKWDGVRALAAVQHGRWQLWGRELADYTPRYPELEVLGRLPSGTVVDGELVVFQHGRAKLDAILRRHQLVSPRKIRYTPGRTHALGES